MGTHFLNWIELNILEPKLSRLGDFSVSPHKQHHLQHHHSRNVSSSKHYRHQDYATPVFFFFLSQYFACICFVKKQQLNDGAIFYVSFSFICNGF